MLLYYKQIDWFAKLFHTAEPWAALLCFRLNTIEREKNNKNKKNEMNA